MGHVNYPTPPRGVAAQGSRAEQFGAWVSSTLRTRHGPAQVTRRHSARLPLESESGQTRHAPNVRCQGKAVIAGRSFDAVCQERRRRSQIGSLVAVAAAKANMLILAYGHGIALFEGPRPVGLATAEKWVSIAFSAGLVQSPHPTTRKVHLRETFGLSSPATGCGLFGTEGNRSFRRSSQTAAPTSWFMTMHRRAWLVPMRRRAGQLFAKARLSLACEFDRERFASFSDAPLA